MSPITTDGLNRRGFLKTSAPIGGNLDVQEIAAGNKAMFRVNHDGAHLFLGDCHALQGDGEANGMGAIEVAARLTVRVTLEDAMRTAFQEMIYWLEHICKVDKAILAQFAA